MCAADSKISENILMMCLVEKKNAPEKSLSFQGHYIVFPSYEEKCFGLPAAAAFFAFAAFSGEITES